jgi:hypothetical protein
MKKSLLSLILAVLALSFNACEAPGNGESDLTKECTEHDFDLIAQRLGGNYFHDAYSDNSYNYNIILSADGSREVVDAGTGLFDLAPDMPLYSFDLYAPIPSLDLNKQFNVPVGTYSFDAENSCNPGTMAAEYTYRITLNGVSYDYEQTYFTAGTVEVTKNGIEAILIDDRGKSHHIRYVGTYVDNSDNFGIFRDEGPHTTLEGDMNLSFAVNQSMATPLFDFYIIGMDKWEVIIYEPATDSQFELHILAPLGSEKLLGEFPVSNDWNKPQIVLPGLVSSSLSFWSWYDQYEGNKWMGGGPIDSGKMVISENADGSQHIVIDFKDDAGNAITAEFDTDLYGNGGATPLSARGCAAVAKKSPMRTGVQAKAFRVK